MSTIPNSLSVAVAGQMTLSSGVTSAVAPSQGAGFNEALVQVMGAGSMSAVPQGVTTLPAQMLSGSGEWFTAEPAGSQLPDLLKGMEKLDHLLESNPELFSALQAWVAGVQQFLHGNTGATAAAMGEETSTQAMSLDTLTRQPATIRFALQDGVAQLLNMVAANAANGQQAQAVTFLKSLQAITNGTGVVSDEGWNRLSQSIHQWSSPSSQPASSRMVATQNQSSSGASFTLQGKSDGGVSNRNVWAGHTAVQGKGELSDQVVPQPPNTSTEAIQPNHVTTAGELVIKNNGTAPAALDIPVVHVRHFAKEMAEYVVQKLDMVKQGGLSEATIMLRPEHLGQLEVKLSMSNGQLVAQFITEHRGARDLLEQQISHLRASLHSQGIQVNKVEVTHNESLSSHLYQQDQGAGTRQQQERRFRARSKEENADTLKAADIVEELRIWTGEQRLHDTISSSFTAQA